MKEEKITISVNQEDVQNIINCYEKDIERIKQLEEVIKEAKEYIKKHIQKYDIDGTIGDFDEFEILASPKTLLEILSKGENK